MTLGAFERRDGLFNVWRYDTPSTTNILWGVKADNAEHAKELAKEKINKRAITDKINKESR